MNKPHEKIESIEARNRRVELDKAWETSFTRRAIITAITYLIAFIFLFLIEEKDAWLIALVPTGGYLLSTLSLNPIKKIWINIQGDKQ